MREAAAAYAAKQRAAAQRGVSDRATRRRRRRPAGDAPTRSGRCGRCSRRARGRAARARRQRARARRRAGAAERARRLRAARRGREHLGRAERGDHRVDARRRRPVLRSGQRQGLSAPAVLQGAARRARSCERRHSVAELARAAARRAVEYLLRLGDDRLVLGHRLSEWCGHGPILEEDIALANIALDLLGQATMFLQLRRRGRRAGARRGRARVLPRRDRVPQRPDASSCRTATSAFTIVRQFLFDAWTLSPARARSSRSTTPSWPAIAAKALKETRTTCATAASGCSGSATAPRRAIAARSARWTSCGAGPASCSWRTTSIGAARGAGIGARPAPRSGRRGRRMVRDVLDRATLTLPHEARMRRTGGRPGRHHTEHLGHMLAEMQIVARIASGGEVVSGDAARRVRRATRSLAILDTVMDPEVPGAERRRAGHRARRRGRRRRCGRR